MKLVARLAVPALIGLLALATTEKKAHALGPIDVEVGAKIGVGTKPDSDAPVNYLGFGVGGRGGVSIFGLYGGLSAVHYFGGSYEGVDYSSTLLGVEVGYTIKAIPLIRLRPQIGVGNYHLSASSDQVSGSDDRLYLEPGVNVVVPIGLLFVGADANALILPAHTGDLGHDDTRAAFTLHAQIGIDF